MTTKSKSTNKSMVPALNFMVDFSTTIINYIYTYGCIVPRINIYVHTVLYNSTSVSNRNELLLTTMDR